MGLLAHRLLARITASAATYMLLEGRLLAGLGRAYRRKVVNIEVDYRLDTCHHVLKCAVGLYVGILLGTDLIKLVHHNVTAVLSCREKSETELVVSN